jgi:hypothetical protein
MWEFTNNFGQIDLMGGCRTCRATGGSAPARAEGDLVLAVISAPNVRIKAAQRLSVLERGIRPPSRRAKKCSKDGFPNI